MRRPVLGLAFTAHTFAVTLVTTLRISQIVNYQLRTDVAERTEEIVEKLLPVIEPTGVALVVRSSESELAPGIEAAAERHGVPFIRYAPRDVLFCLSPDDTRHGLSDTLARIYPELHARRLPERKSGVPARREARQMAQLLAVGAGRLVYQHLCEKNAHNFS